MTSRQRLKKAVDSANASLQSSEVPDYRQLFGHEEARQSFTQLALRQRLPPVLLIAGRPGIGKRTLASWLAAMVFCESGSACGLCGPCQEWRLGVHPDGLWLAPDEGKHKLESANALQQHLSLLPTAGKGESGEGARLVVLSAAEGMTAQCANRLLKILEEPPSLARIILTCSEPRRLLDTVRSRCVVYRLAPPQPEESLKFLGAALATAGKDVSDDILRQTLTACGLSPGQALLRLGREAFAVQDFVGEVEEGRSLALVLKKAEALAKDVSLGDQASLWSEIEVALNARYRKVWDAERAPAEGFAAMRRRREVLQAIKQLAVGKQIPLNIRLSLEAVGLG